MKCAIAILLLMLQAILAEIGTETTTKKPRKFKCGRPPAGDCATLLVTKSRKFVDGAIVEYECISGYGIAGRNSTLTSAIITCHEPHGWDPRPTCEHECTLGTHNCDVNARCVPTTSSYYCVCDCGFTGDGTVCDPMLSDYSTLRIKNYVYKDPHNEYDQVSDVVTAQDCYIHCLTRNNGACISFSYNDDLCIIAINEGDLNIKDLGVATTYGYFTYILRYGYEMFARGTYAEIKNSIYYLGSSISDGFRNFIRSGVASYKDCAVLCYLVNEGRCFVFTYNDRYLSCLVPYNLGTMLPSGLRWTIYTSTSTYAQSTTYLVVKDASGEPLTMPSYTTVPERYLYRGTYIYSAENTLYASAVNTIEDCYRLCYMVHGEYCKVFSIEPDLNPVCQFPNQGDDLVGLDSHRIASHYWFTAYFVFHPSSRNETFSTGSFMELQDMIIRDGQHEHVWDIPYAEVESLDDCYRLCLETLASCSVFSYNADLKSCLVSSADFYDDWTYLVYITGFNSYFLKDSNRWKLLTKHQSTKGHVPYSSYQNEGMYSTLAYIDQIDDKTTTRSPHYIKSQYIDHWLDLPLRHKIRMELRKSTGELLHYLEFNAAGTNSMNWFSPENFLDSSWTDLSNAPGTFDVWEMVYSGSSCRSFYISKNDDSCDDAKGWMLINRCTDVGCTGWEKKSGVNRFYYAPGDNATKWKNTTGEFDVLKIYMSFA